VQAALTEVDAEAEKVALKSTVSTAVPNGYVGADAQGNAAYNRIGSFAQHAGLSNASQITVTARQMGIEGTSAAVDLTSNPQIVAGSANQEVQFIGTHATNTVKLDNGTGLRLCGNTGSIIIGLNGAKPFFRYNSTLTVWEQLSCSSLQDVFKVDNKILTGSTPATGFIWGDFTNGNYCSGFWDAANANIPTVQCFCGGVICANTILTNPRFVTSGAKPTCTVSIRGARWDVLGGTGVADSNEVCRKNASDVYNWDQAGTGGSATRTTTLPMQLMSIDVSNANAFQDVIDGTNFDYSGVRFVDAATGTAFYKFQVPPNLAATPAWNLILTHKAVSGGGGNAVLTVSAKDYLTNAPLDAALTTLHSAATFAVSTSANTTITTLSGTNYDSTESLGTGNFLVVSISRIGGSGSDTLSADWMLLNVSVRFDAN
jgi:hypothetical protein